MMCSQFVGLYEVRCTVADFSESGCSHGMMLVVSAVLPPHSGIAPVAVTSQ